MYLKMNKLEHLVQDFTEGITKLHSDHGWNGGCDKTVFAVPQNRI